MNAQRLFFVGMASLCFIVTPRSSEADSGHGMQGFAEPPTSTHRPSTSSRTKFRDGKGWFISGDVGIGAVAYTYGDGADHGESGPFIHARFGAMLTQRVALSAELWSDGHNSSFNGGSFSQRVYALALSYWAIPKLWVTAGFGSAKLKESSEFTPTRDYSGVAYMAGLGYEVWSRERYSIDVTMRMLSSGFDIDFTNLSRTGFVVGIGASWH